MPVLTQSEMEAAQIRASLSSNQDLMYEMESLKRENERLRKENRELMDTLHRNIQSLQKINDSLPK